MEEALEDIRNGRFLVVVDDESRENEGDLVLAAEKATPEAINFMAYHARGLVCMPVIGERAGRVEHPLDGRLQQLRQARYGLYRLHRLQEGHYHGHLCPRPCGDHTGDHRPGCHSR